MGASAEVDNKPVRLSTAVAIRSMVDVFAEQSNVALVRNESHCGLAKFFGECHNTARPFVRRID